MMFWALPAGYIAKRILECSGGCKGIAKVIWVVAIALLGGCYGVLGIFVASLGCFAWLILCFCMVARAYLSGDLGGCLGDAKLL